jgi:hypothetical protein
VCDRRERWNLGRAPAISCSMILRRCTLLTLLAIATACSSSGGDTAPVEGDIRETATIRVDSGGVRTLVATLTLENLTATDRPMLWGEDCVGNGPLDVRMYRGDALVWESSRAGPFLECPVRAIQSTLSAKGSASFSWQRAIATTLGDSLAPGTYRFTVQSTVASPRLTDQIKAGDLIVADPVAVPPGTNLNGMWTGSAGGLSVSLAMTWTADSVIGSGTYAISVSGTTGVSCAVSSPPASGTVTLKASRAGDVVTGALGFDAGYFPPYGGRLRAADEFDGVIHSVDSGGCALTLIRSK